MVLGVEVVGGRMEVGRKGGGWSREGGGGGGE